MRHLKGTEVSQIKCITYYTYYENLKSEIRLCFEFRASGFGFFDHIKNYQG